jgi:ABC-type methionine transport system ATPase subunit
MKIFQHQVISNTKLSDNRRQKTYIQLHIPQALQQEPIISRLVAHYGVMVNIAAAQIGANFPQSGCLELELQGTASQIESALTYLDELDLEISHQFTPEEDGW